jgi:hypothetical protein
MPLRSQLVKISAHEFNDKIQYLRFYGIRFFSDSDSQKKAMTLFETASGYDIANS